MRRLRIDHWAWINTKVSLVVWGVFYFMNTPPGPLNKVGVILNHSLAIFTICGAIISVIGMYISTDDRLQKRQLGLAIEWYGLVLALCGPTGYSIIQLSLSGENETRRTLAVFAYSLASCILARAVIVNRAWKRGSYSGK